MEPPRPARRRVLARGSHAGSWQGDQAMLNGVDDELGGLVNVERVHDVGAMDRDSVGAEVECLRDLAIGAAVADELQNLELARGQSVRAFSFQRPWTRHP